MECISSIHQYIQILAVCESVTDVGVAVTNLRVVCKIIACVQRSSCHRNFLEIYSTKLLLVRTLIALTTGRDIRLFGVLDQNKTRFSTYVSQRAESKAATVKTSD